MHFLHPIDEQSQDRETAKKLPIWDEVTPVSRSSFPPFDRVTPIELPEFKTSRERFAYRLSKFKADGLRWPRTRHWFYWSLHNLVAHPTLGLIPNRAAIEFHELTSDWLNKRYEEIGTDRVVAELPKIPSRSWWLLHNIVAHAAIGLLPCRPTFALHDWSAKKMGVPQWV